MRGTFEFVLRKRYSLQINFRILICNIVSFTDLNVFTMQRLIYKRVSLNIIHVMQIMLSSSYRLYATIVSHPPKLINYYKIKHASIQQFNLKSC